MAQYICTKDFIMDGGKIAFVKGKLYEYDNGMFVKNENGDPHHGMKSYLATHFEPKNFQFITRQGLKEIYDVACGEWKTIIEDYVSEFSPFEDNFTISDDFATKMYEESSASQIKVLNKYLMRPSPYINFTSLKIGDCVLAKNHSGDNVLLMRTYAGWVNLYNPKDTWGKSETFNRSNIEKTAKLVEVSHMITHLT